MLTLIAYLPASSRDAQTHDHSNNSAAKMRYCNYVATQFLGTLWLTLSANLAYAQTAPSALDLSLEELMQVVVTSAAKKPQSVAETAAAIFVIHAEDIRRSGATNIPEALRLAPGVQVAAVGNNKWAISIRGQADRFSDKLLVLVDGRNVYSPFFSGVIWENLAVPLENIERIEVLRGPGASLWGSNAVNGVINIITRAAGDNQGGLVTLAAGTELRGALFARQGWQLTPDTAAQVHVAAHTTDPSQTVAGSEGVDDWQSTSAGFRLDRVRGQDSFQVQGGVYTVDAGDELFLATPPLNSLVRDTQRTQGGHLLGRWEHRDSPTQEHSFQAYLEYSDYDFLPVTERRTTLDLEYQAQTELMSRHSVVWGLGYRRSQDEIGSGLVAELADPEQALSLTSAYLQDEITLQPERWRLILGARLEHYNTTGFNFQPNARLLWTPDTETSVWLSLARANRAPSRVERGGIVSVPTSLFSALELDNGLAREEQLDALDLGWRRQINPKLSVDLAAFYYRYKHLRNAVLANVLVLPSGYTFIQTVNTNGDQATASGFEAALDWRPQPEWRIQASYSGLDFSLQQVPGSLANGYDATPEHQFSLRASHNVNQRLRWDAWLRYVGEVPLHAIPDYTSLDLRVSWQPSTDLELSLTGQNLLDSAHPELGNNFLLSTPSAIERGIVAQLRWKFE